MKEIKGVDALSLASEISKLPDGRFTIVFFKYNSTTGKAETTPRVIERCKVRKQLPDERFSRDSENFFLFEDEGGSPKTCYRVLIRFIGFANDNYQLRKVNWT